MTRRNLRRRTPDPHPVAANSGVGPGGLAPRIVLRSRKTINDKMKTLSGRVITPPDAFPSQSHGRFRVHSCRPAREGSG